MLLRNRWVQPPEPESLGLCAHSAGTLPVSAAISEASPGASPLLPPANPSAQEAAGMLGPARKQQEILSDKRHEHLYRDVRT